MKMNSKFKYMYDAASTAALIAKSGAAQTASFNGAAYTLDTLDGYWNVPTERADQTFAIVINVDAVDHVTGDETYKFDLQASSDGFTTNKVVATLPAVPAVGQYVLLVDADTVAAVVAGVTQIRLAATLAGTTPSIHAYAWIAGIQK